jgi:quercetin dioxygenase-like cupin family protein
MILRNAARLAEFNAEKMGKVPLGSGERLYAGLNCFAPGQEHTAHTHADQDKLYIVLEGSGEATVGEERSEVGPGDVVLAPAGVAHGMKNAGTGPLVVLVVFAPPPGQAGKG